jgi:hypothetical protein
MNKVEQKYRELMKLILSSKITDVSNYSSFDICKYILGIYSFLHIGGYDDRFKNTLLPLLYKLKREIVIHQISIQDIKRVDEPVDEPVNKPVNKLSEIELVRLNNIAIKPYLKSDKNDVLYFNKIDYYLIYFTWIMYKSKSQHMKEKDESCKVCDFSQTLHTSFINDLFCSKCVLRELIIIHNIICVLDSLDGEMIISLFCHAHAQEYA